jgi:DNA-binding winged helix-turn-helix (wHTH) protein
MSADQTQTKYPEALACPPASPSFPARCLGFGIFQIDLEREEFWRQGTRVKLQRKVYQTLLVLLSNAGKVVTREEMRKHVWLENSRVNFDANINTTINKLRQVLSDSSERPSYIETIPRRGYCFVAPLEFSDLLRPASPTPGAAPVETGRGAAHSDTSSPHPRYSLPIGLRIATLVLAGMVVGSILVLAWFSYNHSHKALVSLQRITWERPAPVERSCLYRRTSGT